MIYRMKWIVNNLGITRDMIRYYEKKGLLSKLAYQDPHNKYREYDDNDIATLWGIKLLIGIGYSVDDIKQMITNKNYDFYSSLSKKVEKLEADYIEKKEYFEFAKTILLTGKVPTVDEYGSIEFDDFLAFAKKEWNFYSEPSIAKLFGVLDKVKESESDRVEINDIKALVESIDELDQKFHACESVIYCKHINELQDFGYKSEVVQKIVRLFYEYERSKFSEFEEKMTPEIFAKNYISQFIEGNLAIQNKLYYGDTGCEFIAKALAHFGGYDSIYQI